MSWYEDNIDYVGTQKWNAVYTVQLGELIDSGVFDWSKPELDWHEYAMDEAQYNRLCAYFTERFEYREISILPFGAWAKRLKFMLCYELMPKYKPLYEAAESINPLADSDEYYKSRHIESKYPETLLSGNADYISSGTDDEYERIRLGNVAEREREYIDSFRSVDAAICDELESLFISMYTANVNSF